MTDVRNIVFLIPSGKGGKYVFLKTTVLVEEVSLCHPLTKDQVAPAPS